MDSDDERPRNKIQTIIEERDLQDLTPELEQRWSGDGFEEHSIRELTAFFNQEVLRNAVTSAGEVPLEGEIENFHRLLTDDDNPSGSVVQAKNRLRNYGIDVEELESDFVSHQTMYRFLNDIRDIDTSTSKKSTAELIESTRTAIRRLNSRTQSVVGQNITQLGKRDEFTVGDIDIYVNIQFSCSACGETGDIIQLLDDNGCGCSPERE